MLLNPDPIIALMYEQQDRDLALVAIVCAMAENLDDAVDKLTALKKTADEMYSALEHGGVKTKKYRMTLYTRETVGPLLRVVTQLRDRDRNEAI